MNYMSWSYQGPRISVMSKGEVFGFSVNNCVLTSEFQKFEKKNIVQSWYTGMLWCSTVIPLPSTFQNQSVHPSGCWDHWRLYHGVASSGDRSLISWLKMISLFLWSSASCYRMLWSVEIQLPGCNQGQFYKPS